MKQEALVEAGLTINESKVYLALLGLGEASANEITRKSGVHRVNVYDVIDRLMEKGLVSSVTKTNKKLYSAVDPKELLNIMKRKEAMLQEAMPELELDFKMAPAKQEVRYFKGPEGVITAYYMMLDQKKPIFGIGGSGRNRQFLKHRHTQWDNERKRLGIGGKLIYYEQFRKKDIGGEGIELRFLPDEFWNPAMVDICGNLVLILLATDTISCIVIDNKVIADAYKKYFEIMWEISKK